MPRNTYRRDMHSTKANRENKELKRQAAALQLPCNICGQPIDYTLDGNDPQGATVDHLIPVSKGGHPDHPNNKAIAHRHCNVSRNNKITATHKESTSPSRQWL